MSKWTEEHINYLKENYCDTEIDTLIKGLEKLGRKNVTLVSIYQKANKLQLKSSASAVSYKQALPPEKHDKMRHFLSTLSYCAKVKNGVDVVGFIEEYISTYGEKMSEVTHEDI